MRDESPGRAELPSGTVTFLFTDVEGSTERWETHRDTMQTALRTHDEILQSVICKHAGYVFKTIGDAFCAVFATVPAAVRCALDAQRALMRQDWGALDGLRVRMAIHTGIADERDGDYFGPTVNRVARLLAVGHGGQILVSGISKELAEGAMPQAAALHDLGAHRLKDLTHPEQIYQIVASDLKPDFPPLRSLESLPNNLPLHLTSFIGREEDLAEVEQLLAGYRLVTLLGAGGVGKTRLSLQVGANLLETYPDGVWLVELAPLSEASLVAETVAAVFSIVRQGERSVLDSIVASLRNKQTLLVLDNCEHLVAEAARVADAILHGAPKVRILASSREALGIEGERTVRVASLSMPPLQERLTAQTALGYGAIALFVERALAADRRFQITDSNCETIAEICRQLDGIALAIELAAPRIKVLSVEQLASRLNERFRLLTGGNRTALPRQQTMRALIDWSYDLLSEKEKTVFRRSAVFAGSFSLDAASEVCSDEVIEQWNVLDTLASLVDKSLVVADLAEAEQRYHLLVSTRQYAFERLAETPERFEIQRKHATFYAALAADANRRWATTPTTRWRNTLDVEFENFRASVDWALDEGNDPHLGMELIAGLRGYWPLILRPVEALAHLEAAVAAAEAEPPSTLRVRLRIALASTLNAQFMYRRARLISGQALAEAEELGDSEGIALALHQESLSAHTDPTYDAQEKLIRAADIFESLGQKRMIGACLYSRARSSFHSKANRDNVPDERLYQAALAIARGTGDERLVCLILNNLAEVKCVQNNLAEAITAAKEAIPYALSLHLLPVASANFANLAAYLIFRGEPLEALNAAKQALRLGLDSVADMTPFLATHFSALAIQDAKLDLGARLTGVSLAFYERVGNEIERTERRLREKNLARLKQELSEEHLRELIAEGRGWSQEQAVAAMQSL